MGGTSSTSSDSKLSSSKPSATEVGLGSRVPAEGLLLWLDSTRNVTLTGNNDVHSGKPAVKDWKSIGSDGRTLRGIDFRNRVKRSVPSGRPYLVAESGPFGQTGIQTDYLHTFQIEPPLQNIQTVVSMHCFNQLLKHVEIFTTTQDRGTWCNFYLFCARDFSVYPFHSDGNVNEEHSRDLLVSRGYSNLAYRNSDLSLNGQAYRKTRDQEFWTEPSVAILKCDGRVEQKVDLIGAERQCHHFSGIIHELMVFDRELGEDELTLIKGYLFDKYFRPSLDAAKESLSKIATDNGWEIDLHLFTLLCQFVLPDSIAAMSVQV